MKQVGRAHKRGRRDRASRMRCAALVAHDVPDDGVLVLVAQNEICLSHQSEDILGAIRRDEPQILRLLSPAFFYRLQAAVKSSQVEDRRPYRRRPRVAVIIS